jgi:hypothetical protein
LDASPEWCAQWAPVCTHGNLQRAAEISNFRLKGTCFLQLSVTLISADNGLCHLIVDEQETAVYVRAIACLPHQAPEDTPVALLNGPESCTGSVWLRAPLDKRRVISFDTGKRVRTSMYGWENDPWLYDRGVRCCCDPYADVPIRASEYDDVPF